VRKCESVLASSYRCEVSGSVRRIIGPFPLAAHNWIDFFSPTDEASIDDEIQEQISFFKSIGHSFRWKIYSHDQPPGLGERLQKFGFERWDPCALMILDLTNFQPQFPDDFELQLLTSAEALPAELRSIKETVWEEGADEFISSLQAELLGMGEHIQIFAAKKRGETCGCGLTRYNQTKSFGGLFAGATVPSERGKGVYRGLVGIRAEEAKKAGADFLYTEAGPMSQPILERIGFEYIGSITNYVLDPAQG
jgi:hypothetical protein